MKSLYLCVIVIATFFLFSCNEEKIITNDKNDLPYIEVEVSEIAKERE